MFSYSEMSGFSKLLPLSLNIFVWYLLLNSANASPCTSTTSAVLLKRKLDDCIRLPTDVIPLHYSIFLHPDIEKGIFKGLTNITILLTRKKDIIALHSVGLNITNTRVRDLGSQDSVGILAECAITKNEMHFIHLNKNLKTGKYLITMEFSGILTNKISGFYKSTYKDGSGAQRSIATSKFEPTYARQAFPCFDEPSFKANFSIQLVKPSSGNYIALSNMNQLAETVDYPRQGLTTVQFAESVPMSTYLVCFIVCDFKHLEQMQSKQGFPVTVYARPEEVKNMKFALEHAVKTIDFYIEYFGIQYPLPKLDLIAIPDFVSGAMEHWGLVTFRETNVLYSESSSTVNKKQIALTVSHELAHMWFGNLVTMEWWNDLWLNEGFARFMEYKGAKHTFPDWDVDTQILTDEVHRTLSLDSTQSSHPIVQTVSHPDQITEIFDTISYSKGAAIIRMLEEMVSPTVFQRGVSNYLKNFEYNNAETVDLWNSLEKEAEGINISKVMAPWTQQKGFPLLNVERSEDVLVVSQQRFLAISNATYDYNESEFHYKWDIPVTYVTSTNTSHIHKVWLYAKQESVNIVLPANTEWVKFNFKQFGYYRVRYNSVEWQKLVNMLKEDHESVTAADRANLLDDAFSLAKAGYTSYKTAFEAIQYIAEERHFVPWLVARNKLQHLQEILSSTPLYIRFRRYVHKLLQGIMIDSLWDITSTVPYIERRQKIVALELACSLGVPSCVQKAKEIFNKWLLENGPKPEPEIRALVYNTAMMSADEVVWDRLWKIYLSEEDPQEKVKLRNSLTNIREPWILYRYIDLAKDENIVRSQDFLLLIGLISENPVGTPIVWDFIRTEWNYLVKRFTLNNRFLGTLLPRVTSTFSTETKLNELKMFLLANPEAGAGAAGRKIAVERIENNIRWIAANTRKLSQLLSSNNS